MRYYTTDIDHVLADLSTTENGLSGREAALRLEKNGKNRLAEAKKDSLLKRFVKQLIDPMIIILLAAALISAVTAIIGDEHFTDVIIILAVVLLNAVLGVYQESKAEKAIEALQKMAAATSKVLRDGEVVEIPSEELVVGDVVYLDAGDAVPADGRIIESASLRIEEAALTGESVPVNKSIDILYLGENKSVPLGDRTNMAYMGSIVVYGRGRIAITKTGMDTQMGRIAEALNQAQEEKTPLQRKLGQLSKTLSFLVLGICVFMFIVSLLRAPSITGHVVLETFMVAVSLAVAAIPEGLATVVTVVLSIGVTNMARKNAIIRHLTAVETLGCAEIICSDKTGTLTQNKMTVVETCGEDERLLCTAMALCNDAEPTGAGEGVGDPTEIALVDYAAAYGLEKHSLEEETPRVGEAPFDSMRKMMSTLHRQDGRIIQYTKGAPDEIIARCTHYYRNGESLPLTDQVRKAFLDENSDMADRALRVLCAAMRAHDAMPRDTSPEALEKDMVFLGLMGMIDPIRPEVLDAIENCRRAGMRPIMITGDHPKTAIAIAATLGIIDDASQAVTGIGLDEMTDEELDAAVHMYGVYARVQPEHKVRIVRAWKKLGRITAMTGDGVNDAPSIKAADIGVGMGITGTDVTKNVADMVLADDNFATIVGAVEEGRRIYDNIRKTIGFLLSSNMSEVLAVFTATMLGFIILKPVHLLWINLITDTFPALALGVEKGEPDLMQRKPRDARAGIFAGGLGGDIIYQGTLVGLLTLAAYFIGSFMELGTWGVAGSAAGMTMAFITMSTAEVFHSFNMRSQRASLLRLPTQNKTLWGAALLSFLLTVAVTTIPFMADAFSFTRIPLAQYAICIGLAFSIIPIVELVKAVQR
ncbi:MAG: cation-translocating P-type ATPase, partial [Christensenellales bacterium]